MNDDSWSSLLENRLKFKNEALSSSTSKKEKLVDFFCVVGPTKQIEKDSQKKGYIKLQCGILCSYPLSLGSIPTDLHLYVFPNECLPSTKKKLPNFFTFHLTDEVGTKLYGAALQIYDDSIEIQELLSLIKKNVENVNFKSQVTDTCAPKKYYYLPKCLVLLSHYAMYDTFRKLLLSLYRISK